MGNGSCFLNCFWLDTFPKPFYGRLKHPLVEQTKWILDDEAFLEC